MRLYIATSNPGKLRDFSHAALAFPQIEILPLPGLSEINAPDETADSFLGNAAIKALAYGALLPGELVVADDSGIVVPALNGAPGVRSARYADDCGFAGTGSTDERNLNCLLAHTHNIEQPAAHYTAVLAAARRGQIVATAEGRVDGTLLAAPRGIGGFGYDPIFHLPDLALTMAEIDPDTRLRISHRGRALVALLHRIEAQTGKSD